MNFIKNQIYSRFHEFYYKPLLLVRSSLRSTLSSRGLFESRDLSRDRSLSPDFLESCRSRDRFRSSRLESDRFVSEPFRLRSEDSFRSDSFRSSRRSDFERSSLRSRSDLDRESSFTRSSLFSTDFLRESDSFLGFSRLLDRLLFFDFDFSSRSSDLRFLSFSLS